MKIRNWIFFFTFSQVNVPLANEFSHNLLQTSTIKSQHPELVRIDNNQLQSLSINFNDLLTPADQRLSIKQTLTTHTVGQQLKAQGSLSVPDFPNSIKKEIPNIWRVTIPPNWPIEDTPVLIEWDKTNTKELMELSPWVQRTTQLENGSIAIEGGLTVWIKPDKVTQSGLINLNIRIDLKPF